MLQMSKRTYEQSLEKEAEKQKHITCIKYE